MSGRPPSDKGNDHNDAEEGYINFIQERFYKLNIIIGEENNMSVWIQKENTVKDLKVRIQQIIFNESQFSGSNIRYSHDEQTLIFGGNILQNGTILQSIRNLRNNCSIILLKGNPIRGSQVNPSINVFYEANPTARHFKRCLTAHRNFDECIRSAQYNSNPSTRLRFEEPESAVVGRPTVSDLGRLTERLANSMLSWSNQLQELGSQLKRDSQLPENRETQEYQRARRCIQNNMDACRYAAQLLTSYDSFIIPIASPSPRTLMSRR